jgi:hypothetical protein
MTMVWQSYHELMLRLENVVAVGGGYSEKSSS